MEDSKQVKRFFNVEYDLSSTEFIADKLELVSNEHQAANPDYLCKVTTFCVPDKQLVVSTTEENREFFGADNVLLANRNLVDQSFLTLDDSMIKTFEITIKANTTIPSYITALDMAQAKADEMFEADDTKLPLVTVIDYRWGNKPASLSASIFSDVDVDGNIIPLIGGKDGNANVVAGNGANGKIMESILGDVIIDNTRNTDDQDVYSSLIGRGDKLNDVNIVGGGNIYTNYVNVELLDSEVYTMLITLPNNKDIIINAYDTGYVGGNAQLISTVNATVLYDGKIYNKSPFEIPELVTKDDEDNIYFDNELLLIQVDEHTTNEKFWNKELDIKLSTGFKLKETE